MLRSFRSIVTAHILEKSPEQLWRIKKTTETQKILSCLAARLRWTVANSWAVPQPSCYRRLLRPARKRKEHRTSKKIAQAQHDKSATNVGPENQLL